MTQFTGMIVAAVNNFTQGNPDKNGEAPVILNVVAGKFPNRNVISGTVAKNIGIEVGKTYLLSIREGEVSVEFGRQFVYSKLSELKGMEIVSTAKELGAASLFKVETESENIAVHAGSGFESSKK
jgi:hypothetical protein